MHEAVKKCAQYGLMVDIHDEYRPTGFSRTYPNLMTQEGIRGNEEFPDATHNTILPLRVLLQVPQTILSVIIVRTSGVCIRIKIVMGYLVLVLFKQLLLISWLFL